MKSTNFLVHHQAHKNKIATEEVIKSFRNYHPNDPYVIWSDCGDDYTDISQKYNTDYYYSDFNVGYIYYGKESAYELYDRIRKSCELYKDKTHILWMEDDVIIKGEIYIPNEVEYYGMPNIGNYWLELHEYLCEKYNVNPNFNFWSTPGGAIMPTDTFVNKFDILEKFIDEDYDYIYKNMGKSIGAADILKMVSQIITGKNYTINPQIDDINHPTGVNNDMISIVHGFKGHYAQLPPRDN